jgi:DNA-binding FadR family transcriptional regulator
MPAHNSLTPSVEKSAVGDNGGSSTSGNHKNIFDAIQVRQAQNAAPAMEAGDPRKRDSEQG